MKSMVSSSVFDGRCDGSGQPTHTSEGQDVVWCSLAYVYREEEEEIKQVKTKCVDVGENVRYLISPFTHNPWVGSVS